MRQRRTGCTRKGGAWRCPGIRTDLPANARLVPGLGKWTGRRPPPRHSSTIIADIGALPGDIIRHASSCGGHRDRQALAHPSRGMYCHRSDPPSCSSSFASDKRIESTGRSRSAPHPAALSSSVGSGADAISAGVCSGNLAAPDGQAGSPLETSQSNREPCSPGSISTRSTASGPLLRTLFMAVDAGNDVILSAG